MADNGPIASAEIRLLIERVERIEVEIKDAQSDRKDVYAEAKSRGFDPKIMKAIVALRKLTEADRREHEALLDTYKAALGMLDGTPLGRWAIDRLEKKDKPADDDADQPDGVSAEPAPAEPQATIDEARAMGGAAARDGKPVTSNPFPARDIRRAAWDESWCAELGSDGMDIPDALKPKPKAKKAKAADESEAA